MIVLKIIENVLSENLYKTANRICPQSAQNKLVYSMWHLNQRSETIGIFIMVAVKYYWQHMVVGIIKNRESLPLNWNLATR